MQSVAARLMVGLFAFLGVVSAASAQDEFPASREDAVRVLIAFTTIELVMARCTEEFGGDVIYDNAALDWIARNDPVRVIADAVLHHLGEPAGDAEVRPRAEQDTAALFATGSLTPADLCGYFVEGIGTGALDLSEVEPELHARLWNAEAAMRETAQ